MAENEKSSPEADISAEDEESSEVWIHWEDAFWQTQDDLLESETISNVINGTRDDLLSANRELSWHYVPVLTIMGLLLLLSIIGNILVCLVYRTRFRRNTASLFVVFLAVLEIVSMCLGVPMETAVLALPLLFDSGIACKLVRYVETVSVCSVLLVLTAVATDRYCKLTRPTNFLSMKWAKGLCVGAVLLAVFLSLPALRLFGRKTVPSGVVNVLGKACGIADDMRSSSFRIIYAVVLLSVVAFTLVTMSVLYVLMFVRICRRKTAARGERVSPVRREYPQKHRFVSDDSTSSCGAEETRKLPTSNSSGNIGAAAGGSTNSRSGRTSPGLDPARVPLKAGVKESARIGQGASKAVDVQSTRMTWIFLLVSVVCFVSTGPFVVLRTVETVTDLLEDVQPLSLAILYQVCLRFYLLHAPIVPLVYILCNHSFRRESKHLLRKMGRSCKRQSPASRSPR